MILKVSPQDTNLTFAVCFILSEAKITGIKSSKTCIFF